MDWEKMLIAGTTCDHPKAPPALIPEFYTERSPKPKINDR